MKQTPSASRSGPWSLFVLAIALATPALARGEEPLETVRQAFRDSTTGLHSGIGRGVYRHFEAVGEHDWQLKRDADITTYFDGKKFRIDLVLHRDEPKNEQARRIIYDGRAFMGSYLAPEEEGHFRYKSEDWGDGLAHAAPAGFPWDVSRLAANAWDPDLLVRKLAPRQFDVKRTSGGDLVGTHSVVNSDRYSVRFECRRRAGFNLTRLVLLQNGQTRPVEERRLEWKQAPNGLWYVRSLETIRLMPDGSPHERDVLKYTEFEPNAKLDPRLFTEDARRIMANRPIGAGPPGDERQDRSEP